MPLDREKARAALLDTALGTDLDIVLDALEGCVTPRLAEVDARIVSDAEAKLARIRALAEEPDADDHDSAFVYAPAILEILDAPS